MPLTPLERIVALEEYVARNDQRITALEQNYDQQIAARDDRISELERQVAAHQRGAHEREMEMNAVKADLRRIRWAAATGRKP